MGRFGALDGLLMLGLHLALTWLGLWLGSRPGPMPAEGEAPTAGRRGAGWKPAALGAALLLSFILAFIAHVIVLNLLKQGWPAGLENVWIKRPLVAIAWAAATAAGLWLALRPAASLLWTAAAGSALAYLIFALWRA